MNLAKEVVLVPQGCGLDNYLALSLNAYRRLKTNLITERAEADAKLLAAEGANKLCALRLEQMAAEVTNNAWWARWGVWVGSGLTALLSASVAALVVLLR